MLEARAATDPPLAPLPRLEVEEEDAERYRVAVRRALEYIAAGDIYQANLAREWRARLPAELTPAALPVKRMFIISALL